MSGLPPVLEHGLSTGLRKPVSFLNFARHSTGIFCATLFSNTKWSRRGSNPLPSACKADALPGELQPHKPPTGLEPALADYKSAVLSRLDDGGKIYGKIQPADLLQIAGPGVEPGETGL